VNPVNCTLEMPFVQCFLYIKNTTTSTNIDQFVINSKIF